ncbi:sensor histidine kinase [Streptomyces agglomeratus]|uniref:sensor histidine kinase n=2 Tax=Streptomyces agglomeratus TaxID=285458 RepID=UPI0009A0240A|nr:histidine kinase [Streptomyces agglomeratus]
MVSLPTFRLGRGLRGGLTGGASRGQRDEGAGEVSRGPRFSAAGGGTGISRGPRFSAAGGGTGVSRGLRFAAAGSGPGAALQGGVTGPEAAPASALADDVPAPSIPIQINALQALCRQVFGFRLAMIALGAPFALARAGGQFGGWLVGGAVVFSFVGSYAMLRDWEVFGPLLIKYRTLMGVDVVFGSVLLLTASPDSALGYATVCTPLLAGLLYGWRGAGIFTAIQILLLVAAYTAWAERMASPASTLLISGFCVAAGIIGVTLRNLMFRFGAATQALSEANARLAVTDAVEGERARLAREMHDSVAKTLHGVAMAAEGLAQSADRMDPLTVKHQAGMVARSARRAAAESREILSDLRRQADYDTGGVVVGDELAARLADFGKRTGMRTEFRVVGEAPQAPTTGTGTDPAAAPLPAPAPVPAPGGAAPVRAPVPAAPGAAPVSAPGATPVSAPVPESGSVPTVPHAIARHLLTIATEAMENSHRHAHASRVAVEFGVFGGVLRISVLDDGRGLPAGISLDDLRKAGHFGLVGMVERAAGIGARIRIGRGRSAGGTEVRLELPTAALVPAGATGPRSLSPLPALPPLPPPLPPPRRHSN